jgi:hypothetical protein
LVIVVNLCSARGDFGLREVAHGIAQGVDVFTELKVQAG